MSAYWDLINLGVCIKNQADRLGIEHEGIPLEGVVVRIAERALESADPWPDTEDAAAAHYAACNPEPADPWPDTEDAAAAHYAACNPEPEER